MILVGYSLYYFHNLFCIFIKLLLKQMFVGMKYKFNNQIYKQSSQINNHPSAECLEEFRSGSNPRMSK